MRGGALAVALLLLAGCGAPSSGVNKVRLGGGDTVSLDLPASQQPSPDDIYGAVSGLVVDDAIRPLAGAQVLLKGLDRSNATDGNGRFVFEHVPPGLWVAQVDKDGYAQGLGTLNVKSGAVAKSVVQAKRLPYVAPYHQTLAFTEYSSQSGRLLDGPHDELVGLDAPPKTVVVEAKWSDVVTVGDVLDYKVSAEGGNGTVLTGSGPNPLRLQLDAADFSNHTYDVRVEIHPADGALPPDSSGRLFVTAFYVTPAPADWSFVRGDT